MRILLKIGGAQLEHVASRRELCAAIAEARSQNHQVVVVHGGGNQIRAMSQSLGLADRYHDGLRITDEATAKVVLMVLAGQVNRTLTAALQRCGLAAVGLTGADGGSFAARQLQRPGVDLGYVGTIDSVQPRLCNDLLARGYVPVFATVAPSATAPTTPQGDEPFYNLNADHAASPLCRALNCDALLFLTDVPGVLGHDGNVCKKLSEPDCEQLLADGIATGGMLPKLEAALLAAADNPKALIKIAPATGPHAVLQALQTTTGTSFVASPPTAEQETHHG